MSSSLDAALVVERGIPGPTQIPLMQTTTVLGNSSDADITVNNPYVSRKHCQIRHQDHSFYIRDLASTNGSYLNSVRLNDSEEKQLNDGDLIDLVIDQVVVKFRHEAKTLI